MRILKIIKRIANFFADSKKIKASIQGNHIHKEKDVMHIETGSGDVNIENYRFSTSKGAIAIIVILLVVIVVIAALIYVGRKNDNLVDGGQAKRIENQYICGTYDGLMRQDNETTAFQCLDSEFYISNDERKKGNYIRILAYVTDSYFERAQNYESEEDRWRYIHDIYQAVCISTCIKYGSKIEQGFEDQWRYIEDETGVYISTPFFKGKKDFVNSIVNDREKVNGESKFILQKCLYFGELYIIEVMLSHDGTYEEFLRSDSEADLKLKKSFQSFEQIYETEKMICK